MRHEVESQIYKLALEACAEGVSMASFARASRRAYLKAALVFADGNRTQAARLIGCHRNIFSRPLKEQS